LKLETVPNRNMGIAELDRFVGAIATSCFYDYLNALFFSAAVVEAS
jgi:hypothetical protein